MGAWQNPREKPVPDFCSLLLLLPPHTHTPGSPPPKGFPSTQWIPMMNFRPRPHCGIWWVWKPQLWTSKKNSSPEHCANRIFACVREIKKRLEVFLHSLSLPPSPLSLYLVLAVSRRLLYSEQEDMAAGETQLYAKVSNKLKGRSTPSLLDPLLAMGFPTHTA